MAPHHRDATNKGITMTRAPQTPAREPPFQPLSSLVTKGPRRLSKEKEYHDAKFVSTEDEITGIFDSVSERNRLGARDDLSRELWSVRSVSSSVLPKATRRKNRRHINRRSTSESPDDVTSMELELMANSTFSGTNDATTLNKERLGSDTEVAESPVLHSSGTAGGASGSLFIAREGFSHDESGNVENLLPSSQVINDSSHAAARVESIRLTTHNEFDSDDDGIVDDMVVRRRGIKVAHMAAKKRTGSLLVSNADTNSRRRLNGASEYFLPPLDIDIDAEQIMTTTTRHADALAPPLLLPGTTTTSSTIAADYAR